MAAHHDQVEGLRDAHDLLGGAALDELSDGAYARAGSDLRAAVDALPVPCAMRACRASAMFTTPSCRALSVSMTKRSMMVELIAFAISTA